MENFKELSIEELHSINGGFWPIVVKVVQFVAAAAAAGVVAYYASEAVQGIEDGLNDDCCDCKCN